MTESKIKEIREEVMDILSMHMEINVLKETMKKLRPVFDYASIKAKEEELNDTFKEIRFDPNCISVIREVPGQPDVKVTEAQTAEKLLSETQIYIAGFMDASNTIWNHLESCSESIRIQNGEKAF